MTPDEIKRNGHAAYIPGTTVEIADAAVDSVLAGGEVAKCYEDLLISDLVAAGEVIWTKAKTKFFNKWPKDFSRDYFNKLIRQEKERIQAEQPSSKYILTSEGGLKGNLANCITMLRDLPLAFDQFASRVMLTGGLPWRGDSKGTPWTDIDDIKAAEWCQQQRLDVGRLITTDAAESLAREKCVHPVRTYLNGLEWDGTYRVPRWLHDYFGCKDSPYVRAVAVAWMVSAVARVMQPGCQADYTLVLEGAQGKRKSSGLRVLGGEWFTDDIAEIGTKDSAMQLQGKWIVEISELDAFRRAEMTTIKAWLVRREDHFRPPYGRRTADFPRQNVFAASTNKDDWGHDETGLRRFWPVTVGEIKTGELAGIRDRLWAEAVHRYHAGEQWYLANSTIDGQAALEQYERQETDAWVSVIGDWIDEPMVRHNGNGNSDMRSSRHRIFLGDILYHCLGIQHKDWNQGHKMRIGRIMKLAGYVKKRENPGAGEGNRAEYWERMRG